MRNSLLFLTGRGLLFSTLSLGLIQCGSEAVRDSQAASETSASPPSAAAMSTAPSPTDIVIKNQVTNQNIFEQLTPEAREVIRTAVAGGPFPDDPVQKRAAFDALFAKLSGEPEKVLRVEDRTVPVKGGEVPVRIYRPKAGRLPVLVYYHGGGFNKGSLQSHDVALRALANRTGAVVVAVAYRLTPEHQYPTQIDDAYAALQWVAKNAEELGVDGTKLAVGGDSVGGNLAAVTSQRARDQKGPKIGFLVLFYPVTDVTLNTESWREMAQGPWLTKVGENEGFSKLYLPAGQDPKQPYVSPLQATDFKNLPPALVIDAQFDPYRDEGQQYAQKLKAAGVPVTATVYPGVIHDFLLMGGKLPETNQALAQTAAEMRKAFGQ